MAVGHAPGAQPGLAAMWSARYTRPTLPKQGGAVAENHGSTYIPPQRTGDMRMGRVIIPPDHFLVRFRRAVEAAFGDKVERVVLFGSRARGDARPDSDWDVAVFLKEGAGEWKTSAPYRILPATSAGAMRKCTFNPCLLTPFARTGALSFANTFVMRE
jgi:hypothetical protein